MDKVCVRCNKTLSIELFQQDDKELKTCSNCRERYKLNNIKNKCSHNKKKYYCKQCNGGGICDHGKRRTICYSCKTGLVKEKYHIYECKGYIKLQWFEDGEKKEIRRKTKRDADKAMEEIKLIKEELEKN